MSKSSELDRKVKTYILGVISEDSEGSLYTIPGSIRYTQRRFESEFGHEIQQRGRHAALRNWLQGLALNIAFNNHDILRLAVDWGSIPCNYTEKQADKILENYWNFMAAKLLQLFDGCRVPKLADNYFIEGSNHD